MNVEGILQLVFCHLGPTFDAPTLSLGIELPASMAVGTVGARVCRLLAADCWLPGVLAAHRKGALAFAFRADVSFSFALLLTCLAFGFLPLGAV
jgi:hypothetical protein